jgi:hypothetical protein
MARQAVLTSLVGHYRGQSRRAHPRLSSSLGNAHQALSQSRTPHRRWTLPACPRGRTRPPPRPLAKPALPPYRRRRARLAHRFKSSPGQAFPHLPRSSPQPRIPPPPKPRPKRRLSIRPLRLASRCARQIDLFYRSAGTGSGSPCSQIAQDTARTGCADPLRHADECERERIARLAIHTVFPYGCIPARARIR